MQKKSNKNRYYVQNGIAYIKPVPRRVLLTKEERDLAMRKLLSNPF